MYKRMCVYVQRRPHLVSALGWHTHTHTAYEWHTKFTIAYATLSVGGGVVVVVPIQHHKHKYVTGGTKWRNKVTYHTGRVVTAYARVHVQLANRQERWQINAAC